MPRYVILRHQMPSGSLRETHWDLMFEHEGVLRTWAAAEFMRGESPATLLSDHRLEYLDYEGPVSGNRGSVTRWDRGDYTLEASGEGIWIARMRGEVLSGRMTLRRDDAGHSWMVSFGAAPTSG